MSNRPSLLFVFADQMRGMDMGCAGNGQVRTPAPDRLDPSVWLDLEHPFEPDRIHEALAATRRREVVKALARIRG